MMFACVCVFLLASVSIHHRLSMFSHKIFAYQNVMAFLLELNEAGMELCMALVCIQTPTHIGKHTTGTRKISIHLTFNMPIYERNVNCLDTLASFSQSKWWCVVYRTHWGYSVCVAVAQHFHFHHFLCLYAMGAIRSWAYELTLSVWMSELG